MALEFRIKVIKIKIQDLSFYTLRSSMMRLNLKPHRPR